MKKPNAVRVILIAELFKALQSASKALTDLDPLAEHHNAVIIDDALLTARKAGVK